MKKELMGMLFLLSLVLGFCSCEKSEINVLQIRWGIVEDGNPTAGNANLNYYAAKEAYDAVSDACKKCGGTNYITTDAVDNAMINAVDSREIQTKMDYIAADSKTSIESVTLNKLWSNRTFRIEYKFGTNGNWISAYEYVYPQE